MSICNYYAIDRVLTSRRWEIKESHIKDITKFFKPYLDEERLVLIPRFNGDYVSFRYCGLEVLQLTKKGVYRVKICERNKKIRGAKKPQKIQSLNCIKSLLDNIKGFLEECINNYGKVFNQPKEKRYIPGFSLEHWLESIILSDNHRGVNARKYIGVNTDLKKVVSQAPVILNPDKNSTANRSRNRHHHIDILSFNDDSTATVVELKKDNDLAKAKKELEEYTKWLMKADGYFHKGRGNPEAMMKEGYLPPFKNAFSCNSISAIAVVTEHENGQGQLYNNMKFKIIRLPDNWLTKRGDIFT